MADTAFVLVTIAFFVISIGYVAACDRLMKWGDRWLSITPSACSWASGCWCTSCSRCSSRRSS